MGTETGDTGAASTHDPGEHDEAALAAVMRDVPRGAAALAGSAVALLMICWLLIYILVFLPRGSVG